MMPTDRANKPVEPGFFLMHFSNGTIFQVEMVGRNMCTVFRVDREEGLSKKTTIQNDVIRNYYNLTEYELEVEVSDGCTVKKGDWVAYRPETLAVGKIIDVNPDGNLHVKVAQMDRIGDEEVTLSFVGATNWPAKSCERFD